jgi:imidazole glycerol phosphate synthase subunit HisF
LSLALEHNREEVLGDLEGTNHQNIRNFRKSAGTGAEAYGEALNQNNQEVTILTIYTLDNKTETFLTIIKHLALNVEDFVAQLLVQRGIETFEDAKPFFRPSLEHLQ